jgi:hypothetical protein
MTTKLVMAKIVDEQVQHCRSGIVTAPQHLCFQALDPVGMDA